MLLGGDFNRRAATRISVAVTTVLLVQVVTLGAKSIGEKIPEFAAALFVIPIVTTIVFIALAHPDPNGASIRSAPKGNDDTRLSRTLLPRRQAVSSSFLPSRSGLS